MSDAPASFEAPVESGPADSGQIESSPDQSEAPQPAEPEYLDIDDSIANRHVRVKVDGEEISVPLSEALQGYQRQAAFTRHSQQLAEQRREAEDAIRLHQAMQVNPGLTMQVLASRAGMSVEQYLGLSQQERAAADAGDDLDQYDDPLEREIMVERRAREALEQRIAQRDADEQLRGAVYGLQQQYGLNEDQVRAVVGQTMQMGLGIEMLPVVYQAMAFQAQQAAQQQAATQQQATDAQRQAAAAQAAAVVGNGTGVVGGSPTPANPSYSNYREAILAAYDEVEANRR